MITLCKYMPLPQCLGDLGGVLAKPPKSHTKSTVVLLFFSHFI